MFSLTLVERIKQQRMQALLVTVIVLAVVYASAARLLTYDFSLPYIDYPDEPTLYLKAQEWRGLHDLQGNAEKYPPAVISLNYAMQIALEQFGYYGVSPTTEAMRLISVMVNLITLGVVMAGAYRIGGSFAAAITGIAWAASPVLLRTGIYALADPWVYLLAALTVFFAIESLLVERHASWIVWSAVAGLLAILFKYPAGAMLSACGITLLIHLWRNPRMGRRYLGVVLVLGVLTVFVLLVLYRADRFLARDSELSNQARENGLRDVLVFDRVWNNIYYALWPLGITTITAAVGIGLLAYVVAWRRGLPRINAIGLLPVAAVIITLPWLSAMFVKVSPNERLRDVLPATHVAYILIGAALAQAAAVVGREKQRSMLQVALLAVLLLTYRGDFDASRKLIENRRLPDTRAAVREWADAVLEPGPVIVYYENEKTFNPYWGNSEANKWFGWWRTKNILEHSLATWREDYDAQYALLSLDERARLAQTPQGRAFLEQLLPLREFGTPGETRGPQMVFYRLWPVDVTEQVHFGDTIQLRGYDYSTHTVPPGGEVTLRFYWRAAAPPQTNYLLFVHLTPLSETTILAQADGAPGVASRPTLLWTDPDETIISQPFVLHVPPDLPPGTYQVRVGLYDGETYQRLPVQDGDSLPLMQLTVTQQDGAQDGAQD